MSNEIELSREMGVLSATMIGVGAMIGAGIFVLTGIAAGTAGPGLLLAFFLNGIVTLFTALAYAELGSAIPEAGGGYLWIKHALPSINGFISGWMSWFAHAVAGSLYALGFGAYFGLLLENYHISIFGLSGAGLNKFLAVFIALIFIYINYRGASETGTIANIVGFIKIAILGIFVVSGLYTIYYNPDWFSNFNPFLPKGFGGIFMAMGLTFIAFEGYEVIAQTAEEVKNPKKNIPKAIFLSLLIVIPIYLLVAFAAIGALKTDIPTWQFLGQYKELGLLEAARQFMPFGTFLLLIGGLVSTMSALNATTFSSTRVSFAMGRDFNLPGIFKKIHPVRRTPYSALLISGALIIIMAVGLPIEDVASAADVMFLLLFLQVNIAVIMIRKKFGKELEYGYKMPLFPIIPILGVFSQLFLAVYMFNYSPRAWYATIIWIAIGFLIYYGYSLGKEKIEKGKVARSIAQGDYRVVVSFSTMKNVEPLIAIGAGIAKAQQSEVVALHVIGIPRQTFLETGNQFIQDSQPIFEKAISTGKEYGIEVRKKIVASHNIPQAILDISRSGKSNLILLGGTEKIFHGKIKQSIPHIVMRSADCDVGIFFPKNFNKIKKILVPLGLGEHAYRVNIAENLAAFFNAKMTIFTVVKDKESVLQAKEKQEKAIKLLNREVNREIEVANSIGDAVLKKSRDYDLCIISPSTEWILHDVLFGSLPDKIVKESRCSVLILKQPEQRAESWIEMMHDKIRKYVLVTKKPNPR
ncbi:putative Kdp system regulatory protein KdpQ [uncultured archaeon]|nr:putative Kdp system regulatory protein KdpQ [uncultured archaeon]